MGRDDDERADAEERLGEFERAFDGRGGYRRAVGWLVLLGAAVVMLLAAAIVFTAAGLWRLGAPAALLAAACAFVAAPVARGAALRHGNRVVSLFGGGLAVGGGPEGEASYTWDDLVSVTLSGVRQGRRTRWRLTLLAEDGRVLRFGEELPDVSALGEAVAAEVASRQVPRHLAAVKAGDEVCLGPFTVDLEGVGKEGERLPWHAVRDVVIENGVVAVRTRGERTALAAIAGHMPDALVFTALCSQVKALNEGHR
ncbi:DUF6585 family protein [Actinomadura litoris]|uniref:DUF6585 family protein n=1 Tax=Actinomadura litoris TaxID=2678616 RepID=UPI001FA70A90|nr:DUF6585 family protein [Actinomadura litoris]